MRKRRWATRYWVEVGQGLVVTDATYLTIKADRTQVRWFHSLHSARVVVRELSDLGVACEVRRLRVTTDAALLAEVGPLPVGAP